MRTAILLVALLFTLACAALTIAAAARGGVDVLTVLSALVVALFGFGIVGALREPEDD